MNVSEQLCRGGNGIYNLVKKEVNQFVAMLSIPKVACITILLLEYFYRLCMCSDSEKSFRIRGPLQRRILSPSELGKFCGQKRGSSVTIVI